MRALSILIILFINSIGFAQLDDRITTIDFVQIVDNNEEEATYYYEHNWKVLRNMAIEKGYIHSYEVMETPYSEETPFHLMLITTYANKEQYDLREDNFGELIKEKGELKLMNDKQPGEFRKTLFGIDEVRHWAIKEQ